MEQPGKPGQRGRYGSSVVQINADCILRDVNVQARSPALGSEVFIPCLHNLLLAFRYDRLDSPQFPRWIAEIVSQRNRVNPELGRVGIPVDMHVRRLVEVMTDEVESVRS
jgi:hypothetical protein